MPLVSIIIVNYNGNGLISACLKALEGQTLKDFEIIIVDNSSLDDSLREIKNFLQKSPISPFIKLVPLDKNLGFAGGNIEGLKYAKGEYIALLNNDAEPGRMWVEELVRAMDSDPKVGICASKLIVYDTYIIDSAGDGYATSLKGFKGGEGENGDKYNNQKYVFGACAAAALYRRKMLDEIGFMDEDFFLIHEDTDLNFRAQLTGWKVLYVPTAIVYHKVRSSIGHMSDTAVYYTLRNSEFVRIKNTPFSVFLRCLPEFFIGMITEFIYFAIKHMRPKQYFKAKMDALRLLSKMLKKRTAIMKSKKVSSMYLLSIMTPLWQRDFLRIKIKKFLYD